MNWIEFLFCVYFWQKIVIYRTWKTLEWLLSRQIILIWKYSWVFHIWFVFYWWLMGRMTVFMETYCTLWYLSLCFIRYFSGDTWDNNESFLMINVFSLPPTKILCDLNFQNYVLKKITIYFKGNQKCCKYKITNVQIGKIIENSFWEDTFESSIDRTSTLTIKILSENIFDDGCVFHKVNLNFLSIFFNCSQEN